MGYTFAPVTDFEKLLAPLEKLYGREKAPRQLERYRGLVRGLEETFGKAERCALFSAPGRTEIGGNHTDHQHGRVLAGSVDLDVIAAVKPSGGGTIRIQSEGFPMDVVDLSDLSVHEEERNRSVSILRGLAAWFSQRGCRVEGFDAYTTSNVLKGSGLSSSAAFEVLVANIINDLFCDSRFTPVELAQAGQYAENVYFGKPSGLLDQMASSVGAMVTVDFKDNAVPVVERVDFDFAATGYALCIIDSGADHADLTDEYAAVTAELGEVCACFGKRSSGRYRRRTFTPACPRSGPRPVTGRSSGPSTSTRTTGGWSGRWRPCAPGTSRPFWRWSGIPASPAGAFSRTWSPWVTPGTRR